MSQISTIVVSPVRVSTLQISGDNTSVVGSPKQSKVWQVVSGMPGPTGPAGPPGSGVEFVFASPLTTWTINHNLGYRPIVETLTAGGVEVEGEVIHLNTNQVQVQFKVAQAGYARIF